MRIAVAGASGFVGAVVCAELRTAGHAVVTIGRGRGGLAPDIVWDPAARQLEPARLEGFDAIVNATGETIAQRWTDQARRRIVNSRLDATSLLASTISALRRAPSAFVSISAVGYYGDTGEQEVDESAPKGSGFLADVVEGWEQATSAARDVGIRVVHPRLGVVLGPQGGALAKLLLPFKLGAGGKVGSGRQWMSWISLTDVGRAVRFLIERDSLSGAVNVSAPSPVRNEEFASSLGRALKRPAFAAVPEIAVKVAFGEMGKETLLAGQRVIPRRLLDAGFVFELPDIDTALRTELARR